MLGERVAKRFWSKVRQDERGVFFRGARGRDGYGRFWLNGESINAHRVAYMLTKGPIPSGKQILHQCVDKRTCVNPDHLLPGTAAQNQADKFLRGRSCHGEKNGRRKLSERHVHAVDRLHVVKRLTYPKIARILKITAHHVGRIYRRESWGRTPRLV